MEDEEYIYDDDYPREWPPFNDHYSPKPSNVTLSRTVNDPLPPMPALGWDGFTPEVDDRHRQVFLLDNNRRPVLARMDNRNPFPPRFIPGTHRDLSGKLKKILAYFLSDLFTNMSSFTKISAATSPVAIAITGSSRMQMTA
jgi:hypothetical protein